MAPTVTVPMTYSTKHLPLNNKLRKLLVQKLRRDRLNNSIEQIRTLLGQEFVGQHPNSKQEKADLPEMTVLFLNQKQQQRSSCSTSTNKSSSRYMQEAVNFLSQREVLMTHFLHWTRAPDSSLNPALQSTTAAAKRLQTALHSGDPGRDVDF